MIDSYEPVHSISKILSSNDVGKTGAHQAGILVPKASEILSFFPSLGTKAKNPRVHLSFIDDDGKPWTFAFIYYNNAMFGGTRNEYRLTRMTPYFKQHDLKTGDEILFFKDSEGNRHITHHLAATSHIARDGILRIGNEWKVIKTKEF